MAFTHISKGGIQVRFNAPERTTKGVTFTIDAEVIREAKRGERIGKYSGRFLAALRDNLERYPEKKLNLAHTIHTTVNREQNQRTITLTLETPESTSHTFDEIQEAGSALMHSAHQAALGMTEKGYQALFRREKSLAKREDDEIAALAQTSSDRARS
jgi:predicted GNAT superfamily acetyltransferase